MAEDIEIPLPFTVAIEDAVICREIADREPVGAGDIFTSQVEKLYCYTRVLGATEDIAITHNWYYQDALVTQVTLNVRSSNWRTWSSKTILPDQTGEWRVEVTSESGETLKTIYFMTN